MAWRLDIDLGGTKTEAIALEPDGAERRRLRLPTSASRYASADCGVREVARRAFCDSLETPIVRNRLGASASVIGTAPIGR